MVARRTQLRRERMVSHVSSPIRSSVGPLWGPAPVVLQPLSAVRGARSIACVTLAVVLRGGSVTAVLTVFGSMGDAPPVPARSELGRMVDDEDDGAAAVLPAVTGAAAAAIGADVPAVVADAPALVSGLAAPAASAAPPAALMPLLPSAALMPPLPAAALLPPLPAAALLLGQG